MKQPKKPKNNRKQAGRMMGAWAALVLCAAVLPTTAYASGDPLGVVNNLSDFIFAAIRAIGMEITTKSR